jgi:hypothetical protein
MSANEPTTARETAFRAQTYDIDDIQAVMRFLKVRIDAGCAAVPTRLRPWIPNALLNLAVERILTVESRETAADILMRLAHLIAAGQRPSETEAIRLNGHDA